MTNPAHILIVDDSPININLIGSILSDDYIVSVANNAFDALDFLQRFQPDLILLDIMMPKMDGYQLMSTLKKSPNQAQIPVIFITAKSDEATEIEALKLGAVDFISKPISPAVVKLRIKNHLTMIQQQQQIQHSKLLLQSVFESISDAVIVYDQNERITALNPQVSNLWADATLDNCHKQSIGEFLHHYLLPEIDPEANDPEELLILISQKILQKGCIQLLNERYLSYYTAPLYHQEQ